MMPDLDWLTARPIAHRGLHDMNDAVWENTLPAFARAADAGYAIECDVHLSSDGVPVIFHDKDLQRLAGANGFPWQRTAAEMAALRIGTTRNGAPSLRQMLDLVAGRVPLVIELKGTPGHDDGLVAAVAEELRTYSGPAALMSFDHWLIRQCAAQAPGLPVGLTAWGDKEHEIEAHFSMLAHGVSFVSYAVQHMPNRFVSFVKQRLGMPVISWTVRDQAGVEASNASADQMTFEGFLPAVAAVA